MFSPLILIETVEQYILSECASIVGVKKKKVFFNSHLGMISFPTTNEVTNLSHSVAKLFETVQPGGQKA